MEKLVSTNHIRQKWACSRQYIQYMESLHALPTPVAMYGPAKLYKQKDLEQWMKESRQAKQKAKTEVVSKNADKGNYSIDDLAVQWNLSRPTVANTIKEYKVAPRAKSGKTGLYNKEEVLKAFRKRSKESSLRSSKVGARVKVPTS